MYVISLTSIPPRLPRIGPVLESLAAQRPAPDAVYLCLPQEWARFGDFDDPVSVPEGVVIHRSAVDYGPATKVIPIANDPRIKARRIIYCDDDWIYPTGWAAALLAFATPHEAVAASGFNVDRLQRVGTYPEPEFVEIAQGFGGVVVDPKWMTLPEVAPPHEARLADDIWLSGQLAQQGVLVRLCPEARIGLCPAFEDAHGLQDLNQPGHRRVEANAAALEALTQRYGIWPAI
ncbi:MAG: hypothetical protein AAGL23_16200 [Pseudomonadota bacterium]